MQCLSQETCLPVAVRGAEIHRLFWCDKCSTSPHIKFCENAEGHRNQASQLGRIDLQLVRSHLSSLPHGPLQLNWLEKACGKSQRESASTRVRVSKKVVAVFYKPTTKMTPRHFYRILLSSLKSVGPVYIQTTRRQESLGAILELCLPQVAWIIFNTNELRVTPFLSSW